jgi:hypothetical protein
VFVDAEIVIDGLGDVEDAEFVAFFFGQVGDDAGGVAGIVAADVEEDADVVLLEGFEDFFAVGGIGLVSRGAECRGGGFGDAFEEIVRCVVELDEFVIDDAADAVTGAEEFVPGRRRRGIG